MFSEHFPSFNKFSLYAPTLVEHDFDTSFAEDGFRAENPAEDGQVAELVGDWVRDEFEVELAE